MDGENALGVFSKGLRTEACVGGPSTWQRKVVVHDRGCQSTSRSRGCQTKAGPGTWYLLLLTLMRNGTRNQINYRPFQDIESTLACAWSFMSNQMDLSKDMCLVLCAPTAGGDQILGGLLAETCLYSSQVVSSSAQLGSATTAAVMCWFPVLYAHLPYCVIVGPDTPRQESEAWQTLQFLETFRERGWKGFWPLLSSVHIA